MRQLLLFITFFFASGASLCQSKAIDSLNRALSLAKEDTSRAKILIELTGEYDLWDSTGLTIAQKAYRISLETNSEESLAASEVALGLYHFAAGSDSGKLLLNGAIRRFEKEELNREIADTYWSMSSIFERQNEFDSAIHYLEKSLNLSKAVDYYSGIAEASFSLSTLHNIRGNNSLALKYSIEGKENYEEVDDQGSVSESLNQMGIIYDHMGLYAEAIDHLLQAREIAQEVNDVQIEILIINNLGVVYDNMDNPMAALEYYEEALEKSGIFKYKEDEATLLNNISYVYLKKGDTLQAKEALWKTMKIVEKNGLPCFDLYPQEGIGSIYVGSNQLDSANYYLNKALEGGQECEDVGILTAVYKSLGEMYEKQGEYNKALQALNQSLEIATKAELNTDAKITLLSLYNFHKRRGNTSRALFHLENYRTLTDSLEKTKNIEKANQLAAEYEFRKQMESIRAEQLANEMAFGQRMAAQNREKMFIFLALILVFLLLLTLGRSYVLIQRQNKKLKWLNEEKNTLMGVVAHDLRNPLNMIKGLMQLVVGVKTVTEEDDSEKYLHLIKMSTQKMTDMIDKVLDISAIENMKVNLNMSKEDLTKLLSRSAENFEYLAAKKDIKIEQVFNADDTHYSAIDSNYFEQIMDNLISNGIKFSDTGKKITIDIKSEGGFQVVSVKDEGPGISKEEQKNLFNRFQTLAAKPTSNEQSIGLGLSIVKKFVTAMEGEIYCESELGSGTTFFLKFKEA